MSSKLGPLEIHCDAPSYSVVRACHLINFETPEDVRWLRSSHHGNGPETSGLDSEKLFSFLSRGTPHSCSCGHKVPRLEKYTFTFLTGNEASYLLAQCPRCRTVYWDEA